MACFASVPTGPTSAAWRSKPSWYAVSTEDRTISPELERFMAERMKAKTVEVKASHLSLISHPQEITDKAVEITPNDILANVPYHPKCGMWFDHHLLTASNERPPESFKGRYGLAPSAARLVFDYYSERDPNDEALKRLSTLVDETDRLDAAQLTPEERQTLIRLLDKLVPSRPEED